MNNISIVCSKISDCATSVSNNISNNAHYYKKKILAISFVWIMAMVSFYMFTGYCSYDKGGILVGTIQNWIIDIFGGGVVSDVKKLTYIEFDSATNTFNVGGFVISSLGSLISAMYKIFRNLGYMLLIVYLLIGLMEDISFNQMYIEKMVKKFIFFCLGLALIANSMDLIYFIANIGSAVINKIGDVASSKIPSYDALCQEVYDNCNTAKKATGTISKLTAGVADLANSLGYILQLFIPFIIAKISGVLVNFACWSRFIEILIMAIISPLAFADISKADGNHSNAMRAVKNVIALSLSGAMMLLICVICNQIQGALVTNADFTTSIWNCVLVAMVQMGLVQRANTIVKQGLGMS